MSLPSNERERASELNADARLAAMHAELHGLIEGRSKAVAILAQEYCALARLLGGSSVQARGHFLRSQALMFTSELRQASQAAQQSARLYKEIGDPIGEAEAEVLLGKISIDLGAFEVAETRLRYAINLVRDGDAARELTLYATGLNHLAGVLFNRGSAGEALLSLETSLRQWASLGNASGQAHCLTNIGTIQNSLGQYDLSIDSLGKAYALFKTELQDVRSECFILNSLARNHLSNQDQLLAKSVAGAALSAAKTTTDPILISNSLLNLGTIDLASGNFREASTNLEQALGLCRSIGYRTGEQSMLDSLGMLYQKTGRLGEAFASALTIALDLEDSQGELETRVHLGAVQLTSGDLDGAHEQLTVALALAAESESPSAEAEAHSLLAELARQQGEYQRAFEHSQEHLRIKDELFNVERDRQTRNLSIQFEVERARHDAAVYRVRTEVEQEARLVAEQLVQERTADLARAQHEVVTRLAMAAEYRDDTTGEHTRRVGRTAARIARALGWSEDRARILCIAARLHDVGKIGIPDSILLKPGKLTDHEFEQMKTHTLIGSRILSGGCSELLRLAEEIASAHHERWDGSGYSRGLRGEEIPLTGRIVALADAFNALTQARPYKAAWTVQEALSELRRQPGSHFDPEVVGTAMRLLTPPEGPPGAQVSVSADDAMLDEEDAPHILSVFEQLLIERTQDAEGTW